jgi:hypothetical protein
MFSPSENVSTYTTTYFFLFHFLVWDKSGVSGAVLVHPSRTDGQGNWIIHHSVYTFLFKAVKGIPGKQKHTFSK